MHGKSKGTMHIAAMLLATVSATGCATITKGASQSVTIATDPPGAACTLTREGAAIGVISPTPGTLQIEKDKDAISILCRKEGYFDGAAVLDSSFQGMTFGNLIFGGVIGVAVDGASGAMHSYPPMLTVGLTPESFDSTAARDMFFDRRRQEALADYERTAASIRKNCAEDGCAGELRTAEQRKDTAIALLERERSRVTVRR